MQEYCIKISFLQIILSIKYYLQQQIHFNGNIFGNKWCSCKRCFTVFHLNFLLGFADNLNKRQNISENTQAKLQARSTSRGI